MPRYLSVALTAMALCMAIDAGEVGAVEILVKRECHPSSNLVRLSDVADVVADDFDDAQRLGRVSLFPTPAPGTQRFVRAREIQDFLYRSGVNLADCRFSGASQIVVHSATANGETDASRAKSQVSGRETLRSAQQAIADYLAANISADAPWLVELRLTGQQQRQLTSAGPISVSGGKSPWTGRQQFVLETTGIDGETSLTVTAHVAQRTSLVKTVRPLPRGAVVQATDLELQETDATDRQRGAVLAFHSVEDVVGKETTRAIAPGQIVNESFVRRPLLVNRGDVITVYARSGGIKVRTEARARENGSQGDLITIESLLDRSRYFARVTGLQQVEVSAGATQAGRPTP